MTARTIWECDRCKAEILNDDGAQIVWGTAKRLPVSPVDERLVTLCANCRLDFENFCKNLLRQKPGEVLTTP